MTASRINWKIAFAKLCDSPALIGRDRSVIEGMLSHWESGKTMSPGRKRYFLQIQERTEEAAAALLERATGKQTEMNTRLCTLQSKMDDDSTWDYGFVESLTSQEARGITLSTRQIETLGNIEGNWTDEKITQRTTFIEDYKSDKAGMKSNFGKVMRYYKANQPYFRNDVAMWESSKDYVPAYDIYNKVLSGKYAKKVLDGYEATPRFPVGSLVYAASGSRIVAYKVLKKGGFVLSTTEVITAAAKGNKTYSILPIGSATPILVQERFLKGRP